MALQYGLNLNSTELKNTLEQTDITNQGIRTWRSLFGNAGLSFAKQQDTLTTGYSDAIAQAYKSSYDSAQRINNMGLSSGATKSLMSQNASALSDAYNTYIQKYASDMSTAANNYASNVSAINDTLTERGQNFSDIFKSAYEYFSTELANSKLTSDVKDANGNTVLDKETGKAQTTETEYLNDKHLAYLKDDNGNVLSFNDAAAKYFFDANGNLTEIGQEFYKNILYNLSEGYATEDGTTARSFDNWLSDTNPDLREWWVSGDQYNYNTAGTNRGTVNKLLGINQSYVSNGVNKEESTTIPAYVEQPLSTDTSIVKTAMTDSNVKVNNALSNGAPVDVSNAVTDMLSQGKDVLASMMDTFTSKYSLTSVDLNVLKNKAVYTNVAKAEENLEKARADYYGSITRGKKYKDAISKAVEEYNNALSALQTELNNPYYARLSKDNKLDTNSTSNQAERVLKEAEGIFKNAQKYGDYRTKFPALKTNK